MGCESQRSATVAAPSKTNSICIFECVGGKDKGPDGNRKESVLINEEFRKLGWHGEIIKFEVGKEEQIYNDVRSRFCAYISRINPGDVPDKPYHTLLRRLSKEAGLVGMSSPDSMINFGSKNLLAKLNKTGLVPEDTYVYYKIEEFKKSFPKALSLGERVLKQNRGSVGSGIWRVVVED